jgi:RimJ/RimL family protein N-acetyltransferase
MAVRVKRLGPDDRATLDAFLLEHADSSLFLRSNLLAAGIVDEGRPLQATYAGAFEDDALVGVAAHCWNGNMLVQAPRRLDEVVRAAVTLSGRTVHGVVGPWAQVCAVRGALGLADRPAAFESRDELFALALADLVRPRVLEEPDVRCRTTRDDDMDLIVRWRVAYAIETLHAKPGDPMYDDARADMERHHAAGAAFLLERGGRPVSLTTFNARLPDVVQIGGVFTPPELRGRGHARAVVAGQLLAVGGSGVQRAVLFTGLDNLPAQRAYTSIGFRRIGDYGLVRL